MCAAENKQRIASLISGALAAIIAFAIYCLTKAPGLTFIDSGELAAVCFLPGIAHPTGYPLYTIIGWFFIHLLPAIKPIVVLNTLSAIFSCVALFVFSRSVVNLFNKNAIANRFPPVTGTAAAWSAFAGTLLLAFSSVFWSASLVTEVYALHGLFISLFIFLSLKSFAARHKQEPEAPTASFLWFALLFATLGLSFCNHMSTVLFIPSLIYLFIAKRIWQTIGIKRLLLLLVFFLCGISLYLYLPIRAAYYPALNWGNPQTWEAFFWHASGKQYRVWMFSSPSVALQQLEYLLVLLMKSFGIVPLLLVPFGLWHLFHRNRRILWFTLILLVTDILYTINYDIQDVDPYFLPVFFVFALWMGSAVLFFSDKALYKPKSLYYLAIGGLCSLFLFPLFLNFREVDQSKNHLVEQYSRTILQEVKQNALILSFQWDYFCSACYYLQLVEGVRPDVAMIEVQLLKRSWYITQLQKTYKELMEKSRDEVAAYAQELYKFEHGLPYDPQVIQQRYMEMINSLISKNLSFRPVYVTCEIEKEIGAGYARIPEGLVFRLSEKREYAPFETPDDALPRAGDFKKNDRLHLALRSFYTFMLTSRGLFEAEHSNFSKAAALLEKALGIDPHYPLALKGLESINRLKAK